VARRDEHFEMGHAESKPEQLGLGLDYGPKPGVSFLRHGARRYAAKRGATYSDEGLDQLQSDPTYQTRVASAYQEGPVETHRVAKAYRALADETRLQYDYLTRPRTHGGLGVNIEYHPELDNTALYPTHKELIHDVLTNRRLKVNKTGSNPNDTAVAHPYLSEDENDMFRAVHDAFGHAAIGRSFTRHGEEAAYHSHAQMYSPTARRALAAETRGQNSTMIYALGGQAFPEQRAVDLPDWAMKSRIRRPM
jgi:hypothetical protein